MRLWLPKWSVGALGRTPNSSQESLSPGSLALSLGLHSTTVPQQQAALLHNT